MICVWILFMIQRSLSVFEPFYEMAVNRHGERNYNMHKACVSIISTGFYDSYFNINDMIRESTVAMTG